MTDDSKLIRIHMSSEAVFVCLVDNLAKLSVVASQVILPFDLLAILHDQFGWERERDRRKSEGPVVFPCEPVLITIPKE